MLRSTHVMRATVIIWKRSSCTDWGRCHPRGRSCEHFPKTERTGELNPVAKLFLFSVTKVLLDTRTPHFLTCSRGMWRPASFYALLLASRIPTFPLDLQVALVALCRACDIKYTNKKKQRFSASSTIWETLGMKQHAMENNSNDNIGDRYWCFGTVGISVLIWKAV